MAVEVDHVRILDRGAAALNVRAQAIAEAIAGLAHSYDGKQVVTPAGIVVATAVT